MLASRCGDHCTQKWFRVKPPPRFYPFTTTCMASSSLVDDLLHPHIEENENLSVNFWWSPFIWIKWPSDLFPEDQDTHHQSCLPSHLERKNPHFCVQNMSCSSLHQTRLSAEAGAAATVTRVCFYYVGGAFPVSEDLSRRDQSLCANSTALPVLTCVRKTSQLLDFFILKMGASVCSYRYWVCICGGVLPQGWTRARGHPRALVFWAV